MDGQLNGDLETEEEQQKGQQRGDLGYHGIGKDLEGTDRATGRNMYHFVEQCIGDVELFSQTGHLCRQAESRQLFGEGGCRHGGIPCAGRKFHGDIDDVV